ncbi:MAG: CdaR family protein [Bryobacteraceae bacterium]
MRQLITNNLIWKLVSVVAAVALWMVVVDEPELTTTVAAPVQYKNVPRGMEVSSDAPYEIQIQLRGPAGKLEQVGGKVPIVLDLSSQNGPGERTYTIGRENAELPQGVQLTRAVPSQVRLRFERRVTKEVPVQVRFAGPPPPGYRVRQTEIAPSVLRIAGPQSSVERIDMVETDPIELGSVVSKSEFRVHSFIQDSQVSFETPSLVTVRVYTEKIPR